MTILATPADLAEIQSLYPYMDIQPMSRQLEQAMMYYIRGFSLSAASRAAGYTNATTLTDYIQSEEGNAILEYINNKHFQDIRVTRDLLTQMLFEAHAKSATATEEIAAIRELGKMHDLYENEKRKSAVNLTIGNDIKIINPKQIERMSDQQLLELAGDSLKGLVIDGTAEAVEEPKYDPTQDEDYLEDLDV